MKLLTSIREEYHLFENRKNVCGFESLKTFPLFLDYLICKKRYYCSIDDYFLLEFFYLKRNYRKQFLTKHYNRKYLKKTNGFNNTKKKYDVYQKLKKYFKRELFLINDKSPEEFTEFLNKNEKVLIKPNEGSLGRDVTVLHAGDTNEFLRVYFQSKQDNFLCEEYVKQHPLLDELYAGAVNTCRITSIYDNGEVQFVAATLRIGNGGCVDNMCHGGMGADVDPETGVVVSVGMDYDKNSYIFHPVTGKQIVGFQLPFWEETKQMVRDIQRDFSDYSVLGVDIAFTPDGPCLIELNNTPGPLLHQFISGKPCGAPVFAFVKHHLADKKRKKTK